MVKIQNNQRTLKQFGFHSKRKHREIVERTIRASTIAPTPATGISYRDCGGGKGAFWDHYTIQNNTQAPTVIVKSASTSTRLFGHYVRQSTLEFPAGIENLNISSTAPSPKRSATPRSPSRCASSSRSPIREAAPQQDQIDPLRANANIQYGLLFIPGMSRESKEAEEFPERSEFEFAEIRKAQLVGRPILAVCGGSWTLWRAFGGTLRPVKEHNYRGGMPRLDAERGHVQYNKQIHRIELTEEGCILSGGMQINPEDNVHPSVNSVHWLAPSESAIPRALQVSAYALADPNLAPNIPVGGETRPLNPERCIEAFESVFGAPILGVQWHFEAYGSKNVAKVDEAHHTGILNYMMLAGKTFQLKQTLLAELKSKVRDHAELAPWERYTLRRVKMGRKFIWNLVKNKDPRAHRASKARTYKVYELISSKAKSS